MFGLFNTGTPTNQIFGDMLEQILKVEIPKLTDEQKKIAREKHAGSVQDLYDYVMQCKDRNNEILR